MNCICDFVDRIDEVKLLSVNRNIPFSKAFRLIHTLNPEVICYVKYSYVKYLQSELSFYFSHCPIIIHKEIEDEVNTKQAMKLYNSKDNDKSIVDLYVRKISDLVDDEFSYHLSKLSSIYYSHLVLHLINKSKLNELKKVKPRHDVFLPIEKEYDIGKLNNNISLDVLKYIVECGYFSYDLLIQIVYHCRNCDDILEERLYDSRIFHEIKHNCYRCWFKYKSIENMRSEMKNIITRLSNKKKIIELNGNLLNKNISLF